MANSEYVPCDSCSARRSQFISVISVPSVVQTAINTTELTKDTEKHRPASTHNCQLKNRFYHPNPHTASRFSSHAKIALSKRSLADFSSRFQSTVWHSTEIKRRITIIVDSATPGVTDRNEVRPRWKRGQEPIAKWPDGCSALLVPDPFSKQVPALRSAILHRGKESTLRGPRPRLHLRRTVSAHLRTSNANPPKDRRLHSLSRFAKCVVARPARFFVLRSSFNQAPSTKHKALVIQPSTSNQKRRINHWQSLPP